MNTNANLLKHVLSYLQAKDLPIVEEINKTYNQNSKEFNSYWREACNNYFCSEFEHYRYDKIINHNNLFSVMNTKYYEKQNYEYFNKKTNDPLEVNWKNLYKQGIENRNKMQNYENNLFFDNFGEDLKISDEIIFSLLKEYLSLPKLRKENCYVENDLNSAHQIHNYDFIYEQQDLFEYYDEIFKNENKNKMNEKIRVKRNDLPFAGLLQNYIDAMVSMNKKENTEDKINFGKLRWYNNEVTLLNGTKKENPISFALKSIIDKITLFCKISFQYIQKYEYKEKEINFIETELNENILDQLFMNEYIKRQKSFFDSAIQINQEMENLNVLVNYLYEDSFANYPCFPKFSIYRMMISIWNKEVLTPLISTENLNQNLYVKVEKFYRNYLTKIINKNLENNSITTSQVESPFDKKPSDNNSIDGSTYTESDRNSCSNNISGDDSLRNSYARSQLEMENSDINIKYYIEQIASSILDMDCNEYSVFYINHTEMKVSKNYIKLEEIILYTLESVVRGYFKTKPENKFKLIEMFRDLENDSNLNNQILFINRSKIHISKVLCKICIEMSMEDLSIIFSDFIKKNTFTAKEASNFVKTHGYENLSKVNICENPLNLKSIKNEIDTLQFHLYSLALNYLKNNQIAEYATLFFLKDLLKNQSLNKTQSIIQTIQESINFYYGNLSQLEDLNYRIMKENKRRNIHYDLSKTEVLMLEYAAVDLDEVETFYLESKTSCQLIHQEEIIFRNQNYNVDYFPLNNVPIENVGCYNINNIVRMELD